MMGPPERTVQGWVDRLLVVDNDWKKLVTVWLIGRVECSWFTSLTGEPMEKAILDLRVIDHDSGDQAEDLLARFTPAEGNGGSTCILFTVRLLRRLRRYSTVELTCY